METDKRLTIVYNDQRITIDPVAFAKYSTVFSSYYKPNSDLQMKIEGEQSVSAFISCLPAVQGSTVKITPSNINDLTMFAEEWGVDTLKKQIALYQPTPQTPDDVLCNAMECISKKQSLKELIPHMAQCIDQLLQRKQFALIPPKIIDEVLKHPKCHVTDQHLLAKIVLFICSFVGRKYSFLLDHVKVDSLTEEEIDNLLYNENVDYRKAPQFSISVAKYYWNKYCQEKQKNMEIERSLEDQIHSKKNEAKNLRNKIRNSSDDKQYPKRRHQNKFFYAAPKEASKEPPKTDVSKVQNEPPPTVEKRQPNISVEKPKFHTPVLDAEQRALVNASKLSATVKVERPKKTGTFMFDIGSKENSSK
ncbi:F5/8 type C domain containing protein [Histomonas meleagridis]|uniref:F5/8 type C domain containing protein n=1 Tax=Histomonas meleagridis TaxID=135588 RepID=UPI0035593E62|nr:F5/8 type C domain containing protein [Histomonas meleagridis]KAH0800977.1 F5/8 type C domain containing protein [Histomonas meleagridis]